MPSSGRGILDCETSPNPSLAVSGLSLRKQAAQLGPITLTLTGPGCWWLAGPSGAGKSLLLESLAGSHGTATGSIRMNLGAEGVEVGDRAPEDRSISLMPQRWRLFPHWTVARNLRFPAKLSKAPETRITELAERLQVAHLLKRPTRALSGGETQRIVLIQTLLSPARVLLLDEPLSAVDAPLQAVVLDLLQEEAVASRRICLIAVHRPFAGYAMEDTFWIEKGRLVDQQKTAADK